MIGSQSKKRRGLWVQGKALLNDCRSTFKEGGLRAVIRRYGWKVFAVFFVYYLVRDITLYLVIPSLLARQFWH